MSAVNTTRDLWFPQSEADRQVIREELSRILESSHFCNSKRYPAFLRYVVEKVLEGDADAIKERRLGVEVFRRPADYDTNNDTIVRYTAGEVRKRLALYYYEHTDEAISISLPVGSYVPEFVKVDPTPSPEEHQEVLVPSGEKPQELAAIEIEPANPLSSQRGKQLRLGVILASLICLSILGIWRLRSGASEQSSLDRFWAPIYRAHNSALIVAGGNVFSSNLYSGTETAAKGTDYPFVSMQVAEAITQIHGQLQKGGVPMQLQPAAGITLTDLREKTFILVGGYNNEWTLRLLAPLRYHFTPAPRSAIVDQQIPGKFWERNKNLPYSNSDDYAIICRFRDTTTDSLILAVAGLGRNGTEAAAQFVSTPHYVAQIESSLGYKIDDRNLEAVLKVGVIDGKTAAPTLIAAYTW